MAFSLSGVLSLNNSGFTRGMAQAESASSRLTGKVNGTGKAIKGMIVGAAAIAGIGIGIKNVADVFVGFQKEMSNVKALTGETSDIAMKGLTEKAKEMGRLLPASATDAAKAMSGLGSAGFTTNEIMKSIEGTLYLATAAQTDMATAADITSSTLRGFGLEAGKSGHVSDVLALAAAKTNAGIIDMGESLKYSAPVAHAFGISLEEITAATGLMANAGIKGSMSGTTLRSAMMSLTKVSKPAQKAMDNIGFSAFDSAGKMNPLSKIIGDIKEKTKGLTQEQKNGTIGAIFGKTALSGMLTLIDSGPEKLNALTKTLQKADGAAKQMAETQTDNLYGALKLVEGQFETLKINIGEKAAPAITKALKGIAGAIPKMGDAAIDAVGNLLDFANTVGTAVKPALNDLKEFIKAEVVPRFETIINTVHRLGYMYLPELTSAFNDTKAVAGEFVTGGLDLVQGGLQWILENKELVCAAVIGVGTSFVTAKGIIIGAGLVAAVKNIFEIILLTAGGAGTLMESIAAVTGVASATAFQIGLVAGVVAVFAIIVYECYKHWDGIKAATGMLVSNMGVAFRNVGVTIQNIFKDIANSFNRDVVNPVIGFINKIPGMNIKPAGMYEMGKKEEYGSVTGAFKQAEIANKGTIGYIDTSKKYDFLKGFGKNANGTAYFSGGSSLVNERGGEMQVLRNGTSIIPAEKTDKLLKGDKGNGQTTHIWNIDAKGMDVNELVTELKLRLANI